MAALLRLVPILLALAATVMVSTATPRFYSDDPIAREPESRDAAGAQENEIGLMFELSYNLFVTSKHTPSDSRAGNINTIDEVPDSSWFTNRAGRHPLTAAQMATGPVLGPPPAAERWTIVREKTEGANPGFTAKDARGELWFVAFDQPGRDEGPTAAVVIASKLFWALGYNQVEMFISSFDPAKVSIDPAATKRRPSGDRTPFTKDDLYELLDRLPRRADGTYRVAAGRLLEGKILGGFRYSGTRSDDPNDIVPHEHRRELRALRVFGAWTNLTDLKAKNTLDTLVTENGKSIVRHVLQDVGSTLGMANRENQWDIGHEYFYESDATRRRLYSLGFALSPWQTIPYTEYPAVGLFEGDQFDPRAWKPQTPTMAYMEMRDDDAFWAARRVMAVSDELIRAAVHTGEFSDPAAEAHLANVLMKRRDAIGRSYLTAINPVVDPRLDAAGTLTVQNAAVAAKFAAAPAGYRAAWSRFDNATGATTAIGETRSATTTIAPPAGGLTAAVGSFIQVDVSIEGASQPAWARPVSAHFRRTADGWKLVGFVHLPDRPGPKEAKPTGSSR
ncbi:MAG TPA: hypothetical protein VF491_18810 [Vicinamibacterales bacterium]